MNYYGTLKCYKVASFVFWFDLTSISVFSVNVGDWHFESSDSTVLASTFGDLTIFLRKLRLLISNICMIIKDRPTAKKNNKIKMIHVAPVR